MYNSIVFDVGDNLIGLMDVENKDYQFYYGDNRIEAIELLENAIKIITFNGLLYDIEEVNKASVKLRNKPFSPNGEHIDIMSECWEHCYAGSLTKCYGEIINIDVYFPDTHLGSNEQDVYKTLTLWNHLYNNTKNL
jgi:hypothetical protein